MPIPIVGWRQFTSALASLCGMLLILAGCGGETNSGMAAAQYVDPQSEFPRLRFPDGQISLNDRCPVRRVKLNRRMPPIYVNGRPVGFC